ncbi:MAG TPA: SH3 domain-containing protein [Ktedonosporobacter sp.]|nr:SH3 domain-containing protein [Ktedonosporobacter sp.]
MSKKTLFLLLSAFLMVSFTFVSCGSGTSSSTVTSRPLVAGQSAEGATPATATPDPTPTATPTKTTTQVTLTSPGAGSPPTFQVTWMKPTTMYTTGVAIVRDAPNSDGTILTTDMTAMAVTVYGKTTGEMVAGISTWYRVSSQGSAPQYIYGGRLSSSKPAPSPYKIGSSLQHNTRSQF